MKKISKLALTGLFAIASSTANAVTVGIQDAWQLDTNGAGIASVTKNIGHLNLSGGVGYVNQSYGADFIMNAGDAFTEYGAIYTTTFTAENAPGPLDSGFPVGYSSPLKGLQLAFTGLSGVLTQVHADGSVVYAFNAGVGNIAIKGTTDGFTWTQLADLEIVNPSGGALGDFLGGLQTNGTTNILARVKSGGYTSNLFRDSTGASYDPYVNLLPLGSLYAAIHTQNTFYPSTTNPTCHVNGSGQVTDCDLLINSDGSFNLTVPEPASIALMGIGLLGLVGFSRRRSMKF